MALVSQDMNLNYIRTFVVLGQSKTMTEASIKLNITTSNVSRHIQNLEEELGVTLLLSTPKNKEIKFTDNGKYFLEKYEKIYNEILLAEKEFKQSIQLDNCKITIGINSELEDKYIKDKLKIFSKNFPNICIKVVNGTSEELEKNLLQLSYDFIIDKQLPKNNSKMQEITTKILAETNYCVIYKKELLKSNIWELPFIFTLNNTIERKMFTDYLEKHNIKLRIRYEVDNMKKVLDYVKNGMGAGIIVKDLIKDKENHLESKDIPLESTICISYIKEKLMPATCEFLKLFEIEL